MDMGQEIIKVIFAFFSISLLLFGGNLLMVSYSQQKVQSEGEGVPPHLQQQQPTPQIEPASFIGDPNPPVVVGIINNFELAFLAPSLKPFIACSSCSNGPNPATGTQPSA
jgi:hypothetical protein